MSLDSSVLTVGGDDHVDTSTFSLMYDTVSGNQVTFEGNDPTSGDLLEQASGKLVIGYSPNDGVLTGYKPR